MGKRLHKKSNKKSWTINRTKISDKKSGNKSNKKMGQKIRQKIGQKIRQINRSKNWAENRTKKSGKKSDENSVKKSGKKNLTEKIRQRNLTKNRTKEIGHLCSNPVRTFFFLDGGRGKAYIDGNWSESSFLTRFKLRGPGRFETSFVVGFQIQTWESADNASMMQWQKQRYEAYRRYVGRISKFWNVLSIQAGSSNLDLSSFRRAKPRFYGRHLLPRSRSLFSHTTLLSKRNGTRKRTARNG